MTALVCHWVCLILTVAAVTVQSSGDLEGQYYKYRPASTFLSIIKRENHCVEGDWWCPEDGWCMEPSVRCDFIDDCNDGSDEKDCESCPSKEYYYLCEADGKCIPIYFVCDDQEDCSDGADELQCESCPDKVYNYLCEADGKCIPSYWVCDDYEDCSDGADELQCEEPSGDRCKLAVDAGFCSFSSSHFAWVFHHCYPNWCSWQQRDNCESNRFSCDGGTKCIARYWVCDNQVDCDDKTDEEKCYLPENKCQMWALVGFCDTSSKYYNFVTRWCSGCVPFISDGNDD